MPINGSISDINHLTIRSCNLLTTKDLKNIRRSLSITACDQLTKLENLQGIPLIEISNCPKLDSFDGLKNEVLSGGVRVCLHSKQSEKLRLRQTELNIQTLICINPKTNREIVYLLC
eukprot:gene14278-15788_t